MQQNQRRWPAAELQHSYSAFVFAYGKSRFSNVWVDANYLVFFLWSLLLFCQINFVCIDVVIYEPHCEKTGLRDFRPGPTQTRLYSHRRWLEAWNFGFRKWRDCTIRVAKTKALISLAVTAKLICAFVFAYAKSRFSHDTAHIIQCEQCGDYMLTAILSEIQKIQMLGYRLISLCLAFLVNSRYAPG